jgi:hypothetical protein
LAIASGIRTARLFPHFGILVSFCSAGDLVAGVLRSPDNPTGGKDRRRYVIAHQLHTSDN